MSNDSDPMAALPRTTDAIEVVEEIRDAVGKRQVVICRRATGTYYFEEEHFSEDPAEMCWIPLPRRQIGIYPSADVARREAAASISWLGLRDDQDQVAEI